MKSNRKSKKKLITKIVQQDKQPNITISQSEIKSSQNIHQFEVQQQQIHFKYQVIKKEPINQESFEKQGQKQKVNNNQISPIKKNNFQDQYQSENYLQNKEQYQQNQEQYPTLNQKPQNNNLHIYNHSRYYNFTSKPPNLHQIHPFTLYSSRRGKHSTLNLNLNNYHSSYKANTISPTPKQQFNNLQNNILLSAENIYKNYSPNHNSNSNSIHQNNHDNYASNLTLVQTFNTLEDFFYVYRSIRTPTQCPVDTKIFLFKSQCKPIWEQWLNSGCLLLQFRNNKTDKFGKQFISMDNISFDEGLNQLKIKNDLSGEENSDNQNQRKKHKKFHSAQNLEKQQYQDEEKIDKNKNSLHKHNSIKKQIKQFNPQALIDHIWQFLLFHLVGSLLHQDVIGVCLCKRQKITLIQIWLSKQDEARSIGQQIQNLIQKQISSLIYPNLPCSYNQDDKNNNKFSSGNKNSQNKTSAGISSYSKVKSKNSSISQVVPYTSSTSGIVSVKYKRHKDSINSQSTMKGALNLPHSNKMASSGNSQKKRQTNLNSNFQSNSKNKNNPTSKEKDLDKKFGFFRPALMNNNNSNQTF